MNYSKISGFSDEIDKSIVKQFEALNKLGISYFEPRGVDGKNISELTDDEVQSVKENMKKYGIKVSSIGSPIGKIFLSEDFDAHFETFKKVVKIAKELGAKYIRIFSFFHSYDERETVIEKLNEIRIAAAKNLLISTDLPISEIATHVGFANEYYFSNTFKQYSAATPSGFRKNNKRKTD